LASARVSRSGRPLDNMPLTILTVRIVNKSLAGDATRIRTELGWSPTAGFQDVVRRMVEADLQRG
jgi:nucleoside-diphosphate-sugar epimerase